MTNLSKQGKKWSTEDDTLVLSGLTIAELMSKLGRTKCAVKVRISVLKHRTQRELSLRKLSSLDQSGKLIIETIPAPITNEEMFEYSQKQAEYYKEINDEQLSKKFPDQFSFTNEEPDREDEQEEYPAKMPTIKKSIWQRLKQFFIESWRK